MFHTPNRKAHPMPDESIERARFEEWCRKTYHDPDFSREDTGFSFPGPYKDSLIEKVWIGWFARAILASK